MNVVILTTTVLAAARSSAFLVHTLVLPSAAVSPGELALAGSDASGVPSFLSWSSSKLGF